MWINQTSFLNLILKDSLQFPPYTWNLIFTNSWIFGGLSFSGNMRDWNEEYQACKELPANTIQERIIRDRAIVKVHNDFVESATRGAM